jgi:hypothetical protein
LVPLDQGKVMREIRSLAAGESFALAPIELDVAGFWSKQDPLIRWVDLRFSPI